MEIWKDVPNYDNYQVSNYGNVKRKSGYIYHKTGIKCYYPDRMLKPEMSKGYCRVTLSIRNLQKRFFVHQLVMSVFIGKNEVKKYVNHIDGVPTNNRVDNLEWCTSSENEKHSYDKLGKINAIRKLNKSEIIDIRGNCIKGSNQNNRGNVIDFMLKYNVSRSTICNVLKNRYYVKP